jgi:hypothetical protein
MPAWVISTGEPLRHSSRTPALLREFTAFLTAVSEQPRLEEHNETNLVVVIGHGAFCSISSTHFCFLVNRSLPNANKVSRTSPSDNFSLNIRITKTGLERRIKTNDEPGPRRRIQSSIIMTLEIMLTSSLALPVSIDTFIEYDCVAHIFKPDCAGKV